MKKKKQELVECNREEDSCLKSCVEKPGKRRAYPLRKKKMMVKLLSTYLTLSRLLHLTKFINLFIYSIHY